MIKISNKHNLKMNASFRYYLMYICLIITLNAGRNFVFICKISNEKNPEKEHITVIQFYLILKSNKKLSQNRLSDLQFCKSLRSKSHLLKSFLPRYTCTCHYLNPDLYLKLSQTQFIRPVVFQLILDIGFIG